MEQNFLDKIIATKKIQIEQAKQILPQDKIIKMLQALADDGRLQHHSATKRDFQAAINIPGKVSLVAEIKKSSPSKGILREDFNPGKIAKEYQAAGAAALSVLTDKQFFSGDNSFIGRVKDATKIPVLRKDFIIDEYQIYESALIEADCILLIADILDRKKLENFFLTAKMLNIEVLVESNTQDALEKAIASAASLIGINNRDLNTFGVDIKTTERLIRKIPQGRTIISESGIKTNEDVKFLKSLGVNAVLVGETFMAAPDISAKVKEVMGW